MDQETCSCFSRLVKDTSHLQQLHTIITPTGMKPRQSGDPACSLVSEQLGVRTGQTCCHLQPLHGEADKSDWPEKMIVKCPAPSWKNDASDHYLCLASSQAYRNNLQIDPWDHVSLITIT